MMVEIEPELRGLDDAEVVHTTVLGPSRRFMTFRIGKATWYAISKRLVDDWSGDDIDRATSPESLSLVADDNKQSITQARKWAKDFINTESHKKEDAA